MSVYKDRAEFEQVMSRLFERLMAAPALAGPLTDTDLIVRFRYPDLDSVITFDVSGNGSLVFFGSAPLATGSSGNAGAPVQTPKNKTRLVECVDALHRS